MGGIWVLTAPVHGHCILVTFSISKILNQELVCRETHRSPDRQHCRTTQGYIDREGAPMDDSPGTESESNKYAMTRNWYSYRVFVKCEDTIQECPGCDLII